jgi:hypothetical protein
MNGFYLTGHFYTQHPDSIFSDIYPSYEEAEKELEKRVQEEKEDKSIILALDIYAKGGHL